MDTNLYNREKYTLVVLPLKMDNDKDACFRLLQSNENKTLCHGVYNDKYLNAAIEQSDYIILRRLRNSPTIVVGFGLVQIRKSSKMDILLVCTIPNDERLGAMIAYDLFSFAKKKGYTTIHTSPRTPELRKAFLKYGFEHHTGVIDIDEVLKKKVITASLPKVNKTLRQSHLRTKTMKRARTNRNTIPFSNYKLIKGNLYDLLE